MYALKRPFDVTLVLLAAPLWIPALVVVALLVRIGMGRSVLFRQKRIGLGDRTFEMLKFRTMTEEKDASGNLLPDADRLPALGKWLRGTSIDELPELINVLRGEMSLVGPRPLLVQYLERFSPHHRRRHEVRPGITGLAQVSGRNALTWDTRLDLDVTYVDTASLGLDIGILVRTITAVALRRGISADGDATMPEFRGSGEAKH